jgi:PhnB protein
MLVKFAIHNPRSVHGVSSGWAALSIERRRRVVVMFGGRWRMDSASTASRGDNMADPSVATRRSVVPMLAYEDAGTAIEWLQRAFGFSEQVEMRFTDPDGTVTHAELEAGQGRIMLASPTPEYQNPKRHRETCGAAAAWSRVPWVIDGVQVEVDDVEAHLERARAAGARLLTHIRDEPYGRLYNAEDLEGHRWMFIQPT